MPLPPAPAPAAAPPRLLRLRAFELLIFATLFVLLGVCLAAAPLVAEKREAPYVGAAG